jgi:two-component system chemotaxis response regulator CheB
MPAKPIRVLIVDDSASVRQTLSDVLNADPAIQVMGTAADPFAAARRIEREVPDVIVLDVVMPRMDGITFLRKLMAQCPVPVIMCSALTEDGSETMIEALEAGAVDIIPRPRLDTRQFLQESSVRICDAVKAAACVKMGRRSPRTAAGGRDTDGFLPVRPKLSADVVLPPPSPSQRVRAAGSLDRVVCVGASTGGTESLREVLERLPPDCPGIVVVQHMPEVFTAAFARRLDGLCRVRVKEAENGDMVRRGEVLIAPGNQHMLLQRQGTRYRVVVKDGPLVSRHRPSVDVLFRSAAHCAGPNALGIIMTGMGDDGARGLLEMRNAGSPTVAQDEATCVVFGMPREAINLGAAARVLPLGALAAEIMRTDAL